MDAETLLSEIDRIQQEWWEGDVEMNVALSEIRCLFGVYRRSTNFTSPHGRSV